MKITAKSDKQKAKALIEMAMITLQRLKEYNQEKYPSNTLTDYYDIIHKLMDALSLTTGVKISGEGAHKELIDYIAQEYKLEESFREFIQQMRQYRNRITYEGFMINENYVKLNKTKINKIIDKLLSLEK